MTVLILGATSDIARALAHAYARAGYHPILAARNPEAVQADVSDLHIRYGVQAHAVAFDATAFDTHQAFYDALPGDLEGVLCAVGYLGDQRRAQADPAEARRILDTNYTGCVSILNLLANAFEERGHGFIVGISSVAGDRGRPSNYLYGSAKAGFQAYLSGLRARLFKAGVQVLDVRPGFVDTRMTEGLDLPPLLTASPEEAARDIFQAQQRGRDVRYTRWFWRWIMLGIRSIPERVFKRLSL
jgi:short-subunit dehydrogenase